MCGQCAKLIAENEQLRETLSILRDIISSSLEVPMQHNLTKSEARLMGVLIQFPDASITDICKRAGITRQTYYNALRKPEFQKYIETK